MELSGESLDQLIEALKNLKNKEKSDTQVAEILSNQRKLATTLEFVRDSIEDLHKKHEMMQEQIQRVGSEVQVLLSEQTEDLYREIGAIKATIW